MKLFETPKTEFAMVIASPNLFILTVAAINVLGKGEESAITSELVCCN